MKRLLLFTAGSALTAFGLLVFSPWYAPSSAAETAAETTAGAVTEKTPATPATGAAAHLELYMVFDGGCIGLRRGDMRMIRNTHPSKTIEYRLIRLLGEHRQAGLIRDTIQPGEDNAQQLGCEILGRLEQSWKVVHAEYVE